MKGFTRGQKSSWFKRVNESLESHFDDPDELNRERLAVIALVMRVEKHYHNIFISDGRVLDFIRHSKIRDQDLEMVSQVAKREMESFQAFAIHTTDEVFSTFAMFATLDQNGAPLSGIACLKGDGTLHSGFGFTDTEVEDNQSVGLDVSTAQEIEKNAPLVSFVLNVFLYRDAFPESIIDGPPNLNVDKSEYRNSSRLVASKEIINSYGHGPVSPHIRRGHFRFLKSEKYKNKRFQTVYVKPTMVGATAEHIEEGSHE